ncbi:5-formyltetrahydrofolate cyclo-ligase [Phlebotomus papatasi]|uniref:5-formyltetrahydrofolate cyclo-ligase n=1 Tax=Phlebotomus papatasi TaxID=29031 RepID=UPI0024835358|nr:5-formyltetrahydrofolate cyclo-ligase [Phlebotomus papatasi]
MIRNPAKAALRLRIKARLEAMTPEGRDSQSKAITAKVLALPEFKAAQRISIYLSTDAEVNTVEILKEMFQQKKEVYVPTYHKNVMEMVKLKDFADYESLPMTSWKIKQPKWSDNRESALDSGGLELILMPGVAFTESCGRCGHGMGYYDKFLARLIEKSGRDNVKLIAVAFKEQLVPDDELPMDATDVRLDAVITA